MINIKSEKNAINLQADTELLPQSYVEIRFTPIIWLMQRCL